MELLPGFEANESGLIVQFQDTSAGPADSIFWEFGDGGSTSLLPGQTYMHQYAQEDSFLVCLTTYGSAPNGDICTEQICQWVTPQLSCADISLQASFVSISTGADIDLTDQSDGPVDSVVWDMGNGDVVTGIQGGNYSYTYPQPDTYTVCETVYAFLSDTTCVDSQCITVVAEEEFDCASVGLSASFGYSISQSTYTFTDQSSGNINELYWNFGDGSGNFGQPGDSMDHTYPLAGTCQVCLTVRDFIEAEVICEDIWCQFITVKPREEE